MCLAFRTLTKYVVQSRPITTLYPIPEANDEENHVLCVCGTSTNDDRTYVTIRIVFFLLTTNAPMRKAGGRC